MCRISQLASIRIGELVFLFNNLHMRAEYVSGRTLDRRSCWFKCLNGFLSALERARKCQVKTGKSRHKVGLHHVAFNSPNSLHNHENTLNVKNNEWKQINAFYCQAIQGGMITQLSINLSAVRKCVPLFPKVITKIRKGSCIHFSLCIGNNPVAFFGWFDSSVVESHHQVIKIIVILRIVNYK